MADPVHFSNGQLTDDTGVPLRFDDIAQAGLFKIAEQTAPVGGVASFDFQNISQEYRDLRLVISGRGEAAAAFETVNITINNDTTDANYRNQTLQSSNATNTAAQNLGTAGARSLAFVPGASATAGLFGDIELNLRAYAKADRAKILEFENPTLIGSLTTGTILLRRGLLVWNSLLPVTRLTAACSAGDFAEGSIASLYGIKSSFV